MINYNTLDVTLSNLQFNNLKSRMKGGTQATLNL